MTQNFDGHDEHYHCAKFDMNRFNESPLRGQKPDFWPVSKFNTSSLPLRGNPAGNDSLTFLLQLYDSLCRQWTAALRIRDLAMIACALFGCRKFMTCC